jgi:hypothetical protein
MLFEKELRLSQKITLYINNALMSILYYIFVCIIGS